MAWRRFPRPHLIALRKCATFRGFQSAGLMLPGVHAGSGNASFTTQPDAFVTWSQSGWTPFGGGGTGTFRAQPAGSRAERRRSRTSFAAYYSERAERPVVIGERRAERTRHLIL